MPDDRRFPRARPHRSALRVAAATALAIPVIASVYGESFLRRLGRPVLIVGLLLASAAAVSAFSAPAAPLTTHQSTGVATREPPATQPAPTLTSALSAATAATPTPAPTAMPATVAPRVIRFRPRNGWTGVSRFAAVSVRFSEPMDHATTQRAFHVTVGKMPVTGAVRWAEGDTVLVLHPSRPLPYRARITLSVDRSARSADGGAVRDSRSVTFTVQAPPAPAVQHTPRPNRAPTPRSTAWRWPLIGPITQRFGETKTQYGFHQGIDIDGQTGDRVRASRGGRVTVAGTWDACGGLQVHITHGDGFESWYRHLSRVDVKPGDVIATGTVIGRVGETGCAFGSHLHFAIRRNGTFVDPLHYLPPI